MSVEFSNILYNYKKELYLKVLEKSKTAEKENINLCAECRGLCCRKKGCAYSPDDFKDLSFKGLKKEIDKGFISIAFEAQNIILRVRHVNANIVDIDSKGPCMLLTEKGCMLSFEERPKQGRELIPIEKGVCIPIYSIEECAKEWKQYNEVLEELRDYYIDKLI